MAPFEVSDHILRLQRPAGDRNWPQADGLLSGGRSAKADARLPTGACVGLRPIADIGLFIQQRAMDVADAPASKREIVQRYLATRLRYEFGPEALVYTRTDLSRTHRCCAPYERIGVGNPSYLALNNRLLTIVSLVTAVSVFVVTWTVIVAYQLEAWLVVVPMWVVPFSFLMIRMHSPFSLHFVLLPVSLDGLTGEGPPVWLWDDARGQQVMDELELRWRARLRGLYASVDRDNGAEREVAKFKWLRENEIIEEAEYLAALGDIEIHCSAIGTERSLN